MPPSTGISATDAIALNLFEQLQGMTVKDRRFILAELEGRVAGAAGERLVLVRAALELFVRETGEPLRQQRYERWRVARADADALPSAAFIVGTWNGSWGNAMDELGLQSAPDQIARLMLLRGLSPTDGQLLEVLRSCARELGRTPTLREYKLWKREVSRRPGPIVSSQQTYHERFGGWLHALDAAGLPRRGRRGWARTIRWTWEDAIGYPRWAAAESGGGLTCRRYDAWRTRHLAQHPAASGLRAVPSGQSIAACFGGWIAASSSPGSRVLGRLVLVSTVCSATPRSRTRCRFARETTGSVSSCAYERWQRQATLGPGARPPGHRILGARHGGWAHVAARICTHRLATVGSGNTDERARAADSAGAIAA